MYEAYVFRMFVLFPLPGRWNIVESRDKRVKRNNRANA